VSASATPTAAVTTEGCRFCWMCRQACPVGHVTARETYTPHAFALTIESVRRGQLQWTSDATDVLYACADCGLCQAHCATDRPLPDAVVEARVGVSTPKAATAAVADVQARLRAHANPYRTVPPVPRHGIGKVVLFVGDAGLHLGAAQVAAAQRLLAAAGHDVLPICEGRSSGLLASTLGLRDTAIDLAMAVLDDVAGSGATEVLVLGPGDRWTFEHVYGTRLGLSWPTGVGVREVVDVLAGDLQRGALRLRATDAGAYAYVDPCHTARVGRTRPSPRALLGAAFGAGQARDLFWREHRAHPCGSVGGLEFTQPAIAAKLTDARLADAAASGAAWLVTDDPACLHQLRGRAANASTVRGLFEVLAERV
jgi:Fe-S oxidoreductase